MILSIWLCVKTGKKCFLRFLDLFVFGLCLTCLTYALDITSTTDFFKETGNLIRQVIRSDKNWWFSQFFFSQIKSFKSNFTLMLHRYICHICDIMQLWIDSVGRFPMSAKTQKDKDGKLWKAGIVESLWKGRPKNKASTQLWQLWQSRKWKTDRMFKPGTSCLGCSSMFYLPCCLVSCQFNICDSALVSVVSTLVKCARATFASWPAENLNVTCHRIYPAKKYFFFKGL